MYCSQCGAELLDGVGACLACGGPPPGEIVKGRLIALVRPPFELFGAHRKWWLAGVAGFAALFALALSMGWAEVALYAAGVPLFCGFVLLSLVISQLHTVRVWEHGLEVDIPKSWNKSVYLPWSAIAQYGWEGNILWYMPRRDGFIVLKDGKWPARWPFPDFPCRLNVPLAYLPAIQAIVAGRH
jgi:hypothetical protein